LGYAKYNDRGSAIGPKLASQIHDSARAIIGAGLTDPTFFELIGVFEADIGPDRISDVVLAITLPSFLKYTERVARSLGITVSRQEIKGVPYDLPVDEARHRYVIFFPRSVLRDLPTAMDWDDIDLVCAYNESLRSQINAIIGNTWKEAVAQNSKTKLKKVLLENPAVLADMIKQYREKPGKSYDFIQDLMGEAVWFEPATTAAAENPLDLKRYGGVTADNVTSIVNDICDKYAQLVESNGLWKLLYTDEGKTRHERVAQMLFFVAADSYCAANGLDLSPEVNRGAGPVDFKFSHGARAKVLVEIKLSSNTRLLHGFEKQLPTYAAAEESQHDVLLIVRTTSSDASINEVLSAHAKQADARKRVPVVKIIDGRARRSASKAA
jgi:hypothetical protein